MKQASLFKPGRGRSVTAERNSFDKQNLRAAKEILQDVEKHGGDGAGMVEWARAVVNRIEGEQAAAPGQKLACVGLMPGDAR